MLDGILSRIAEHEKILDFLIPWVRAYVRYAPFKAGKSSLWSRVVDPYFAWHSHRFLARTVFGSRVAGDTKELLQQYLYYFGVWEPCLSRWMARRLRPGDTFIDVGANIGYFSLLASRLVGPSGRVVAIEASPKTFELLKENLTLNRAYNVRALNMAAASSHDVVKVFRSGEHHIGETSIFEEGQIERGFEVESEVDAAPLSAILEPEEIQTAHLVKIDVEGAEWSVVQGLGPLLKGGRNDLEFVVEISPECGILQGKRPDEIVMTFQYWGFHLYCIENDYAGASYFRSFTGKGPVRLRSAIEGLTDAVFSRQDLETL